MQAVLKVVGGKNDGREIRINVPEFVIGRGDQAHLRPANDSVSRMHCAIRLKDGRVEVEDLGSRNGSFINDVQLTGIHHAQSGDRLRIGRLVFEIVIDPVQAGNKKPKVKDIADVVARTVEKPKNENPEDFGDSVSDWLSAGDDTPMYGSMSSETVQFSMEDVESILAASKKKSPLDKDKAPANPSENPTAGAAEAETDGENAKKKKKKEFGKLPPLPKTSHDDSTAAAGDVLKKFFNRR